jgi:hypothetical protein
MSILTQAIYDKLSGDATLTALLAEYKGNPAIFTTDPAPGDATLPYIVTAGEVTQIPFDTKTSLGREAIRDIRIYDEANGSAVVIEAIAERVRALLHRQALTISGYGWILSDCAGPIAADELDAYGRVISVTVVAEEGGSGPGPTPTPGGGFDDGFDGGFA